MTTPLRRRLEWAVFWFFVFCLIVGSAILLINAVSKTL
jgi:hypothetical protein